MPDWAKHIPLASAGITLFLALFGPVLVLWYTRKVSNETRDDTIKTYANLNDALEAKVKQQAEELHDLREQQEAERAEVRQLREDLEWLQREKLKADRELVRLRRGR
jgi:C4-dicarboxylate-specific signal transduction histidine kinase